jgi:gluconolactonase
MRHTIIMVLLAGLAVSQVVAQAPAQPAAPATSTDATAKKFPNGSVFAAEAQVVGEGYAFTEGPAFVRDDATQPLGGYFLFCDVSASKVYRWDGEAEAPVVAFEQSDGALGTAVMADGTLVQCRKDSRSVVEVKLEDGRVATITNRASDFEGKRLNATNDCIVASDGSIWFTDPPFFTPKEDLQLDFTGIYRVSRDGALTVKAKGITYANGLAFSPDEKTLYVNDFRGRKMMSFAINDAGELAEPVVLADLSELAKQVGAQGRGGADGLRVRSDGTLLTTGPGGVYALSREGTLVDFLPTGSASNIALGGRDATLALVTAGGRVMSVALVPVAPAK